MASTGSRGPYRKGRERRQLILEAALKAYATSGTSGPTLRAIAQEVGLTETAVLHYFSSRDELFAAVVQARDEAAAAASRSDEDPRRFADVVTDNTRTPGLVRLFLEVAAASASSDHPGHPYFRDRYERFVEGLSSALLQHHPTTVPDADRARWWARILLAAADGLQLQWLHDPSVDMAADLTRLLDLALQPPSRH